MAGKRTTTIKIDGGLTDEDLKALNQLLRDTAATAEHGAKCERCHVDVTKEARMNSEQAKIAAAIKREFFPNAS